MNVCVCLCVCVGGGGGMKNYKMKCLVLYFEQLSFEIYRLKYRWSKLMLLWLVRY